MKRKYIYDLIIIVFLGLTFLYFQFYTPRSAIKLSQRIDETQAGNYDSDRITLSKKYETYLAKWLPKGDKTPTIGHYYIGQQRKLLDLRIEKAIDEVKTIVIPTRKVRIWSLLNMGVVVKTHDKIISIDTANIPFVSIAHNELTSIADIFLVTHADADHYDRQLLAEALKNKKTIIFPEGFYFTGEDNNPNIYKLKSGQRTNIDGIYVTAFKTDHRGDGNFQIPNCWFLIEVDGFKILHTGDGLAFQNPTESQYLRDRRDIDIMLTNLMLSDENIRNIKPNVAVPLHLFKYIHSREQLKESTFESAIAKYDQKISGIDMKMLFAGEGFEY